MRQAIGGGGLGRAMHFGSCPSGASRSASVLGKPGRCAGNQPETQRQLAMFGSQTDLVPDDI